MPLLKREPDLFPVDLFDLPVESRPWTVAYVRSRQEKTLARYLVQQQIPFYLPQTENRVVTKVSPRAQSGNSAPVAHETTGAERTAHRASVHASSPAATRVRIAYNPLFCGYVFLRHSLEERLKVLQSDVIVTLLDVADQRALASELVQLRDLQAAGASLIPHPWIGVGDAVKVSDGSFKGYHGIVVREHGRERLVVSIDLIRQSVAVEFEREMLSPDLFPVRRTVGEIRRTGSRF